MGIGINRGLKHRKQVLFEKLQEIIDRDWNVFSKTESYRIKDLITQFIENVYLKDTERLQGNLRLIQVHHELLTPYPSLLSNCSRRSCRKSTTTSSSA